MAGNGIDFRSERYASEFFDPRVGFERRTSDIEVRIDPLTGRTARLYPPRGLLDLTAAEEATPPPAPAVPCFFCAPLVFEMTPRSPLLAKGRHAVGEAFLFPNLFPYTLESAVCVFTTSHDLDLLAYDDRRIADALRACRDFLHLAVRAHPPGLHTTILSNLRRSAGSSIAHPHVQALADPSPLDATRRTADGVAAYAARTGRRFHEDLVAAEFEAARGIARLRTFDWIAPFCPLGPYHVEAVGREPRALEELADHEIEDLADGLVRVFRGYRRVGVTALNLLFEAGASHTSDDRRFPPVLRVVARPHESGSYRSDRTALEVLGHEPGLDTRPEEVAESLRPEFADI